MLIDIHGQPLKRADIKEPQTAKLAALHREFSGHPAKGLTPAKLATILQNAEQGDLTAQAELFLDIQERDAHIFSEMSKRKRAVLVPDWSIKPPRNATTQEKADAEYAAEYLEDLDGFEDLLLDLMEGLGHGFAPVEIDGWHRYGNEWFPNEFVLRPQSWFQLAQDNQNELRLRGAMGGEVLQSFNWIVHKPRALSGYIARSGLYRVLVWPYLFKHYAVSDLAEMLEIYGLPIRLGKYPSGTQEEEKATLMRAVMGLGHSAAGIIPETMSIDFEKAAEGGAEPFLAMMRWADEAESKAILGGTLTSNTSASGGGAHALGEVHNEVRKDLRDSDCKQLANTLSRDLLWPIVMLNRSAKDPRRAPRLEFDLKEAQDMQAFSTALPALVNMGMRIPQRWVHGETGIPEPVNNEPVLAAPAVHQPAGGGEGTAVLTQIVAPAHRDQQWLDEVLNEVPAQQLQNQMATVLEPLLQAIQDGKSEAELLGLLSEVAPPMDDAELIDTLHKMLFAADAWGRLFAEAERIG